MANLTSSTEAAPDDLGQTNASNRIEGTQSRDIIDALKGDDWIDALGGNDFIEGSAGFDSIYAGNGNDKAYGGRDGDFVFGGKGNDTLFGDSGFGTAKGSDLSSDVLRGELGSDLLVQGDGNDTMSGGKAADTFHFRWHDPLVEFAAGVAAAFTTITDFNAREDRFQFDAAGFGSDTAGANFVDGGAFDGTPGGQAGTFYSGGAAATDGQAVMVLTEVGFGTGLQAARAVANESVGDLILYYNDNLNTASLLYVDGTNFAHSIARLTNIDSVEELRNAGFSADDFLFI